MALSFYTSVVPIRCTFLCQRMAIMASLRLFVIAIALGSASALPSPMYIPGIGNPLPRVENYSQPAPSLIWPKRVCVLAKCCMFTLHGLSRLSIVKN